MSVADILPVPLFELVRDGLLNLADSHCDPSLWSADPNSPTIGFVVGVLHYDVGQATDGPYRCLCCSLYARPGNVHVGVLKAGAPLYGVRLVFVEFWVVHFINGFAKYLY